jgi:hypothetical protein
MSETNHAAFSPPGGLWTFSNEVTGMDGNLYGVDYYDNGDRFITPTKPGLSSGWFPAGAPVPGMEVMPGAMGIPWWVWLGGAFLVFKATEK